MQVTLNVNIPDAGLEFEHASGFNHTVAVEVLEKALAANTDYFVIYGLRQALADGMAAPKGSDEAFVNGKFMKKLDKAVRPGAMSIREVTRSTDPVKTEARRLANVDLDKWIADGMAEPTKERRKLIIADMMQDEMRLQTARENVEREAARAAAAVIPDSVRKLLGLDAEPEAPEASEAPDSPAPRKRK